MNRVNSFSSRSIYVFWLSYSFVISYIWIRPDLKSPVINLYNMIFFIFICSLYWNWKSTEIKLRQYFFLTMHRSNSITLVKFNICLMRNDFIIFVFFGWWMQVNISDYWSSPLYASKHPLSVYKIFYISTLVHWPRIRWIFFIINKPNPVWIPFHAKNMEHLIRFIRHITALFNNFKNILSIYGIFDFFILLISLHLRNL